MTLEKQIRFLEPEMIGITGGMSYEEVSGYKEYKKVAHVLVGAPYSGKTTWSKTQDLTVYSSDEYRSRLFGDLNNADIYTKENSNKVFRMMHEDIALHNLKEIVYDATNLTRKRRRNTYLYLKSLGYEVVLEVFITPLKKLLDRVDLRPENRLSEDIIIEMYKTLEPPRIDKDCDRFSIRVDTPFLKQGATIDKVIASKNVVELLDLVSEEYAWELSNITAAHDTPYHLETISEHIKMCLSNVRYANDKVNKWTEIALFHDLGKSVTKDGGKYYKHANVSAMYYLNYLVTTKKDFDSQSQVVLETIFQHMNAHQGLSKKHIDKWGLQQELDIILGFKYIDEISRVVGDVDC